MHKVFGVPAILSFLIAEAAVLSLPVFDPTQSILGADPLVVIGASTLLGSTASYFIGCSISVALWRKFNSKLASDLRIMQRDFCDRIVKYRANVAPDPTRVNFSFDYYGERINSIKDYRNWLRCQKRLIRDRTFH